MPRGLRVFPYPRPPTVEPLQATAYAIVGRTDAKKARSRRAFSYAKDLLQTVGEGCVGLIGAALGIERFTQVDQNPHPAGFDDAARVLMRSCS
jgi:hypothetical protein